MGNYHNIKFWYLYVTWHVWWSTFKMEHWKCWPLFGSRRWMEEGLPLWSITGGLLVVVLTLPVFDRRRPIAVQIRMIAAILAQSRKGTSHNLAMNRSSNLNRLVQTCNLFLIQSQRPFMELMATHHGLHIAVCHRFQQLINDGFTPEAPTVSASSTIWFE